VIGAATLTMCAAQHQQAGILSIRQVKVPFFVLTTGLLTGLHTQVHLTNLTKTMPTKSQSAVINTKMENLMKMAPTVYAGMQIQGKATHTLVVTVATVGSIQHVLG